MKIVYEDEAVSLFQGDARDFFFKNELNQRFDCVLTDSPYGITYESNHRGADDGVAAPIDNDSWVDSKLYEILDYIGRATFAQCKDNSCSFWFTRDDVYPDMVEILQGPSPCWSLGPSLFWDKGNWGMGDLTGAFARQVEMIIFATKGDFQLRGARDSTLLRFPRVPPQSLVHSCQKPLTLCQFLIEKSTDPGGLVFDPFCGSGTTLVAAKAIGRRAIGVEISEKHCATAISRLKQGALPLEFS